ncbi:MAG: hypothetical protein WC341_12295, partial [Bacteroidales bacterium]
MKKITVILFLVLMAVSGMNAQVFQRTVELNQELNYQNLAADSSGRQIFNRFASSFNLSPNRIRLQASGVFKLVLDRNTDGQFLLSVSFFKRAITGNTEFSGFMADSILWPKVVTAQIQIYNGRHLRNTIPVTCSSDGSPHQIDISEWVIGRIGELDLHVQEAKLSFQRDQAAEAMHWIEQVDRYYSYRALLTTIKDRYQKLANDNQRSFASISVNHLELERLKWYFDQETFVGNLHLDKHDPVDVLKTMGQIARLVNRAATIFNQELKKNRIVDRQEVADFCNRYVELSTDYLLWADEFQPSVATAFVQMASVPPASSESDMLKSVIHFFSDRGQIPENQVSGCISDLFAKEAAILNAKEDFVVALLMLRNAAFIQNSFKIKPKHEFNSAYEASFDGVAGSYLKVSRMAGLSNNQMLSRTYLEQVYTMLQNNHDFLATLPEQDSALPELFHEALLFSEVSEPHVSYADKINLLDKTLTLSERIGKAWYRSLDSAYLLSCEGYLNQQLTVLDWMLNQEQYPDASLKFAHLKHFLQQHVDFQPDNDSPLYFHAKRIFDVYLQQSEMLMKARQPGVALEKLVLANQVSEWLPSGAHQLIDGRIDSVAFQLIEQMVLKVKFYIWAMRLPEARQKLAEADSIEQLYLDGINKNASLLLASAHQELDDRVCLMAQQKLDVTVNEIRAALQSRAFSAIENAFEMSA